MDGWGLQSVLAKHVTTTTPGRETEKLLIPHRNYKLYVILFYICLILLQLAGRYDRLLHTAIVPPFAAGAFHSQL